MKEASSADPNGSAPNKSDLSPNQIDQCLAALGLHSVNPHSPDFSLPPLDWPNMENFEPFVGTDIEDIDRWRKLLPKLELELGKRIFFPEEHEYCRSYADRAPRYAARWCAKEAVFKALSARYKLLATDIKILSEQDGRPIVDLSHMQLGKIQPIVRLSISHSDSSALAFALALVPVTNS